MPHTVRSEVTIGSARPEDARAMAELFLAVFPDSARAVFGERPPRPEPMTDFYRFLITAEPGGTQVAREHESGGGAELVGFVVASPNMGRLWLRALVSGVWAVWLARYLWGSYGAGLGAVPRLAKSKSVFLRTFLAPGRARAQILSLAVSPERQGQGLGRELLRRGLQYLGRQGVRKVKLEVLDNNPRARRLYESEGFGEIASVPYGSRHWIVMVRNVGLDSDG